jgi:peptidoglycan-associated lipoprotein
MTRDFRPSVIALFTAGSGLLFGACATVPEQEPRPDGAQAQQPGETKPGTRPQPVESKPVLGADLTERKADPAGRLKEASAPAKRPIYFDYDRLEIKKEYRPIVEAHANHLRENAQARMLIQGHADERGSREYNIGLGQRRADSVKSMLILLGGQAKQIESVSLGEEKPVCTVHAESCWWQNRRVDIRYVDEH